MLVTSADMTVAIGQGTRSGSTASTSSVSAFHAAALMKCICGDLLRGYATTLPMPPSFRCTAKERLERGNCIHIEQPKLRPLAGSRSYRPAALGFDHTRHVVGLAMCLQFSKNDFAPLQL